METGLFHKLRMLGRRYVWTYSPVKLARTVYKQRELCTADNDICIEGYPSSANSYLLNLILGAAKSRISICSHCHTIANIKRARSRGLPVFIPVRRPEDAITSRCVRFADDLGEATAEYLGFYRYVLEVVDSEWLRVLTFEAITERPGDVVRVFDSATPFQFRDDVAKVANETETYIRLFSERYGRRDIVAVPEPEREVEKEKAREEVARVVADTDAVDLWRRVRERAVV